MQRYLLLTFLVSISSQSFSQKLLFHKNKYKEEVYQAGDVISFRLTGNKTKITRQILRFEDSLIVFQDYKIDPREISEMYVDRKTIRWFIVRYKYWRVLPVIGAGYFLLEWANTGELKTNTWIFSGSFIGAGILAKIFIPNRIKMKGRRRLTILK